MNLTAGRHVETRRTSFKRSTAADRTEPKRFRTTSNSESYSGRLRAAAIRIKTAHGDGPAFQRRMSHARSRGRLVTMQLFVQCYAAALLLFAPIVVFAIDENPAVKVTQLLKTTSAWDGKQIVYPEGQA